MRYNTARFRYSVYQSATFKNGIFFKVLYYGYSKFGTKITICRPGNIRIQFEKINREETLKNSATESLAHRF